MNLEKWKFVDPGKVGFKILGSLIVENNERSLLSRTCTGDVVICSVSKRLQDNPRVLASLSTYAVLRPK